MPQIKLGELLLKANVLHEGQLKSALAEQRKWGGKLGEILVRMNLLTEETLVKALSKQLNIPALNVDALQEIPEHVKAKIPAQTARDFIVLPLQLRDEGKTLVVAMADPLNLKHVDELRAITHCRIMAGVAGRTAIARAFARLYDETAGELSSQDEGSFKVMDAQGRTLVRSLQENAAAPAPAPSAAQAVGAKESAGALLSRMEEVQRKEVAALKAMVELLIEKGLFTREEYLAKVRR